jgi:hypothetical protein
LLDERFGSIHSSCGLSHQRRRSDSTTTERSVILLESLIFSFFLPLGTNLEVDPIHQSA